MINNKNVRQIYYVEIRECPILKLKTQGVCKITQTQYYI